MRPRDTWKKIEKRTDDLRNPKKQKKK